MRAVLLTADMMASSRIQAAAVASGVELQIVPTAKHALEQASLAASELVLLDLGTSGIPLTELVHGLQQAPLPPAKIVAFGPHVHRDTLQAARDAGCDEVLTRGDFLNSMARFFVPG